MINIITDIPKIYNDPIISRKRAGDALNPYKRIKESITLDKSARALLTEIPNKEDRVKVSYLGKELYEVEDEFLTENTFRVDYPNGIVYFHELFANKTLDFEYTGEGVYLFPDSRIYLTNDELLTARDKFADLDRAILVERHRIDEQILSHPQPSEVVDMRIDYNGKRYRVAKDRIDAEQRKIEEAYIDAHGVKHNSLKLRIDSLQLETEDNFNQVNNKILQINTDIQDLIDLINTKVSNLETEIIEDLTILESKISIIPSQITASVSQLRKEVNGEISTIMSIIDMQADRINMKVDANGIISAINLSPEGVRISGKKIWIDGETRIDNAVIKSAHIDSIDASKIKTGTLSAINIQGVNIFGSKIEGTTIYVDGDRPDFLYTNAIDTNPNTKGVHVYIRPTKDGEVRTTATRTTDTYVPIRTLAVMFPTGKNAHIATDGELRVRNLSLGAVQVYRDVRAGVFHGTALDVNTNTDAVNMYVRPTANGEVRITRIGTTDKYRPIAASEFKVRSSASSKENIRPTKKKGLDIIRKLEVVDFNYIGEKERRLGVIAEKSPEITSEDNEFVNMTQLVSYLLLSIQELDKEIKELKNKLN